MATIDDFKPSDTVRIISPISRFTGKTARVATVSRPENRVYVRDVEGDTFSSGWIYRPDDLEIVRPVDLEPTPSPAPNNAVDHPSHYGGDTVYETIKVLKAWLSADQLEGFCLGNAIKYLSRAGKKSDAKLQDWKKARWYLDYVIAEEERNTALPDFFAPARRIISLVFRTYNQEVS